MNQQFQKIAQWFEALTPETLNDIRSIYAEDASFRDPFNQIVGCSGITQIYRHMFQSLQSPRFLIREIVAQESQAFMTWDFEFTLRSQAFRIHGCTQFVLNDTGLIKMHRDYWDAAEELYEKVPMLGALMRWLKRRLSVKV